MSRNARGVLDWFEQISAIPRCSKNEAQVARWLKAWGEHQGFPAVQDAAGNLLLRVPATGAGEGEPAVILQGHMDMVCEKRPDAPHDFSRDPIRLRRDGDWLRAEGTSLGADNGIALALAMAAAVAPALPHPPLELLFTVEEETGLIGAKKLKPGLLGGTRFLNLDSEEEGVFTVGCAGGNETELVLHPERVPLPEGFRLSGVRVHGLSGGHSGIDIHTRRANANRLLARLLASCRETIPLLLVRMSGGTAHNVIPRDAEAILGVRAGDLDTLRRKVAEMEKTALAEYHPVERALAMTCFEPSDGAGSALTLEDTDRVLHLLLALPHGVHHMMAEPPGTVETSNNLATARVREEGVRILTSQRSAVSSRLEEITGRVQSVGALAGASVSLRNAYPAWQPNWESPLLARCRRTYLDLFRSEARVETIHAGLECAVISAAYPGMDLVSFGPTIQNPHSPDERLHLPSLERTWAFLAALLSSMAADSR